MQDFEVQISIVADFKVKIQAESSNYADDIANKMTPEELRTKGTLQTEYVVDLSGM